MNKEMIKEETISSDLFKEIINRVKTDIKTTRVRAISNVNKELILLYFRIGKVLYDNSKYGNSFIKNFSTEIRLSFPGIKGFSDRNLRRMKHFYNEYKDDSIWPQLVAKLPWSHNTLLIEKIKDKNIRKIYIDATIQNGWSRSVLETQIDTRYHERIGKSDNNFKQVLNKLDSDLINNTLKDPYIFDFISLSKEFKEKDLENAMLERIKDVLLELGKGFSFIGSQYKVSTELTDYYIDLLFYHLDLRCFIVLELKTTEFKPEYLGQIGFYVKSIDNTLKRNNDNPTIGLLLCKKKDKLSIKWSLESTNVPVGISSFELNKYLPNIDELNKFLD